MVRIPLAVLSVAFLTLLPAMPLSAQDEPQWRPPTNAMPAMPTTAELQGSWVDALGGWFRGLDEVTGAPLQSLRASGSARSGGGRAQVVRLTQGPRPVIVLTDRNGDERADMVEIYRDGRMVIQVIDADYSGQANVMRVYDSAGALLRQDRL